VNSSDDQDAQRTVGLSATHVLAWVHGLGPVPAPHSESRQAYDAIQSLRVERELALADRHHRTPVDIAPVMPSGIRAALLDPALLDPALLDPALLDPALIDLRHHDVVQHTRSPAQFFVAVDASTDELVSWEAGDPDREKRWAPAACGGDRQLVALIRAGREAQYPWVYPDVPAQPQDAATYTE
jgi:hypothetical protein